MRHLALAAVATLVWGCAGPTDDVTGEPELASISQGVSAGVIGGYDTRAYFNSPPPGGVDLTITNELVRLIKHTPSGGVIRAAIHSLSLSAVSSALVDAKNRGVNVGIVFDGKNAPRGPSGNVLQGNASYEAVHDDSRIYQRTCQGSATDSAGAYTANGCLRNLSTATMHSKYFIFSQTTMPSTEAAPANQNRLRNHVVFFTSANQTSASGNEMWNHGVVIYGAQDLYNAFYKNWQDMYQGDTQTFPYTSTGNYHEPSLDRGYYGTNSLRVDFSPEQVADGDFVEAQLAKITPDTSCRVRLFHMSMTSAAARASLRDRLVALKAGGCQITFLMNRRSDGTAGVDDNIYSWIDRNDFFLKTLPSVHNKVILVYARHGGTTYQRRVYGGSHNLTGDALNDNEETFVTLQEEDGNSPIYSGFYSQWSSGWSSQAAKDCRTETATPVGGKCSL